MLNIFSFHASPLYFIRAYIALRSNARVCYQWCGIYVEKRSRGKDPANWNIWGYFTSQVSSWKNPAAKIRNDQVEIEEEKQKKVFEALRERSSRDCLSIRLRQIDGARETTSADRRASKLAQVVTPRAWADTDQRRTRANWISGFIALGASVLRRAASVSPSFVVFSIHTPTVAISYTFVFLFSLESRIRKVVCFTTPRFIPSAWIFLSTILFSNKDRPKSKNQLMPRGSITLLMGSVLRKSCKI